jgi:nitrogen fixation protein FixH
MSASAMKQITGRHVLIGLVGFFGVMLIANGIFVYFALTTFGGMDNRNAYQEGLNYNQRIADARKQVALGWTHTVALSGEGHLELNLRDKAGNAVHGLAVKGEIQRPVGDDAAHPLVFRETGNGVYAAETARLDAGGWIVSLEAAELHSTGPETVYRIKERLWLRPNS